MSDQAAARPPRRTFTPDELMEQAREAADYGLMPQPASSPSDPETEDPDIIRDEEASGQLYKAVKFPILGGRYVWVHPVSEEEVMLLNKQARAAVATLNLKDALETNHALLAYARGFQMVYCCRRGPDMTSAPVFKMSRAAYFVQNKGWRGIVQQICALSDRLMGQDELDRREALAGFFGESQRLAEICASRWSTVSPTASTLLLAFASSVSAMRQRGTPDSADVTTLRETLAELAALTAAEA